MNVDECFEKGLLKRDRKDAEKARKSVEVALRKIEKAEALVNVQMHEDAVVNAYAAMFHAGRALLFRDGVVEKSHYALYVYLRERYSDVLEQRFLNEINVLRLQRHEISYGLEPEDVKETEVKSAIKIAREFIKAVKKLLRP